MNKIPVLSDNTITTFLKDKDVDKSYKNAYFDMSENTKIGQAIERLKSPKDVEEICKSFFYHGSLCKDIFEGKAKFYLPTITDKPNNVFNINDKDANIKDIFNPKKLSGLAYSLFEFFEDKSSAKIDNISAMLQNGKNLILQGFSKNNLKYETELNIESQDNLLLRMLKAAKPHIAQFRR
jgi:hypothetical protein